MTVIESGTVTETGKQFTVTGPLPQLAIPTSLHASLLERLDRLAPTREVAQIASALGQSFSHELIGAVAPMPRQQLDDASAQLSSIPQGLKVLVVAPENALHQSGTSAEIAARSTVAFSSSGCGIHVTAGTKSLRSRTEMPAT